MKQNNIIQTLNASNSFEGKQQLKRKTFSKPFSFNPGMEAPVMAFLMRF